jgi:hypothetical protein
VFGGGRKFTAEALPPSIPPPTFEHGGEREVVGIDAEAVVKGVVDALGG